MLAPEHRARVSVDACPVGTRAGHPERPMTPETAVGEAGGFDGRVTPRLEVTQSVDRAPYGHGRGAEKLPASLKAPGVYFVCW